MSSFNKLYCTHNGVEIVHGPTYDPVYFNKALNIQVNAQMTDAELLPFGIVPYVEEVFTDKWQYHELVLTPTSATMTVVDDPAIPQATKDLVAGYPAVESARLAKISTALDDSGIADITYADLVTAIASETPVVRKLARVVWALLQERK